MKEMTSSDVSQRHAKDVYLPVKTRVREAGSEIEK